MNLLFVLSVVALAATVTIAAADEDRDEYSYVTCRSAVKLTHGSSGYKLHSHEIPYGSGSGQQSVTAHPSSTDPNSLFIVKEGHGKKPCKIGDIFSDGDLIRLEHSATHRNVHSHNHRSPLSQAQEVSAYSPSGNGNGDSGDTWRIRTSPGGNDEWFRDAPVLFEHVDTGKYLSASTKHKYNNPIPGQLEVSCIDRQSKDTSWFAQQGFYYPANED